MDDPALSNSCPMKTETSDRTWTLCPDGMLPDAAFQDLVATNQVTLYLSALAEITPENQDHQQITLICNALYNAMELQRVCPEKLDELDKAGAVELAVSVMVSHPKHQEILLAVFHALRALVHNRTETQIRFGDQKGIQLTVRSMLFLRQSEELQLAGTALLLDLTPSKANREIIGQFFGIEVVITAMQASRSRLDLIGTGCAFLANVAFQSEDNKRTIAKSGGIKRLLRALRENASDETIVMWTALALRNLAFNNSENKMLMTKQGGLRYLVDAAMNCRELEKVEIHILGAIVNIIKDDKNNAEQLFKLYGLDLVIQLMRNFRNSIDIQSSCCAILRELTYLADTCAYQVLKSGGLETMLSAMISLRYSQDIQEHGISMLHKMALLGPEARAHILAAGGLETMTSTLNAHILQEKLVEEGVQVIRFIRSSRAATSSAVAIGPIE
jgi:Spinocerebellar ataxia type 10 protein domain